VSDQGAGAPDSNVPRSIGARIPRREDRRLLTGRGTYVDDVSLPRMLHAAFARSSEAHARLLAVDGAEARRLPGVVAVFTAAELEGKAAPIRALNSTPGYRECDTPILASEKVRMVGEPIALVLAESRYAAEDGAAAVRVEYEPLPALLEIEQAIAEGAPPIHDQIPDNRFNRFEAESGDLEGAFARASEVIELELRQQRYGAASLEGRAVIAEPTGDRRLTVWLSSQVPHLARTGIAKFLSMPETRLRVISPDVGGGFGPKCVLYQEDVAIPAAALLLGVPVKWTSDRVEDLLTSVHGREQIHRVRAAADGDGRVLAVDVEIYASNGAYAPWPFTAGLDSGQASENVCGPYDIRAFRRRVQAVVTNKAPMGPYRGVGRVIACLTMERVMDELAARVGLDRLEVRRRNLVREFPYETQTGLLLESGDYLRSLEMLAEAIGWEAKVEESARPAADGRLRGVGVACAVEHSAYGPQALGSRNHELTLGYDTASLRVEPDGRVRLAVGLHSHGQGHETTMAQIAAQELGVAVDDVEVTYGDTAVVPYGNGTWASRSTVYCGGATVLAARDVRKKVLTLAADMLEASFDDLELTGGVISVRGTPDRSLGFREVARRASHEPHLLPEGVEPGLESTRRYSAPDPGSFSSAIHAAQVEVDPETGAVEVLRYVVVEDCGTVINPTVVEGQVHGGVAQGIGGALSEHLAYDRSGQLVSASLMDYLLPTAAEIPPIEVHHLESPSPHTLGGWKGMGEGGAINAPATVVSAVNDALRRLGVVADRTPLDPNWIAGAIRHVHGVAEPIP
jgi:aerobic carbon-monoxide dehydrogenase large subunit